MWGTNRDWGRIRDDDEGNGCLSGIWGGFVGGSYWGACAELLDDAGGYAMSFGLAVARAQGMVGA